MADQPAARSAQRLEISVEASAEDAEALQLEIRRLARRFGVEVRVLGVERGGRPRGPSS
jgi:hypothetical protein